jgi:hypothetical protein
MFEYRVNWYNEVANKRGYVRGLVHGATYNKALKNVINDYGEENIIDVYLQALEDDNTIELETIKEQFNL